MDANEKLLNALITIARLAGKLSSKEAAIATAAVPMVADILSRDVWIRIFRRLREIVALVRSGDWLGVHAEIEPSMDDDQVRTLIDRIPDLVEKYREYRELFLEKSGQ
jgi:hypothetical protein